VQGLLAFALLALVASIVAPGALVVYRGQDQTETGSIMGLLLWLAEQFARPRFGIPGHTKRLLGPIADAIEWVAYSIEDLLVASVGFFDAPVARFWYLLAEVPAQTGVALASFAYHTARKFVWVENVALPAIKREAINAVTKGWIFGPAAAVAIGLIVKPLLKDARDLLSAWVTKQLTPVRSAANAAYHEATVALPRTIGRVGGRVGRLERDATHIRARLRRAEAYLTAAGAAVLFLTAIKHLRMRWLRCSNVGRVGKHVCVMNPDLLEDLLLGTLAVAGTISLVETAKDLQGITGAAVDFTHTLIREA
jgi:hypothetical protein